jgi:hypothetical protein
MFLKRFPPIETPIVVSFRAPEKLIEKDLPSSEITIADADFFFSRV